MREITIHVNLSIDYVDHKISYRLPSNAVEALNQVDVSSDSLCNMLGALTQEQYAALNASRELIFRSISDTITYHVLDLVKNKDTRNGYPKHRG